jgi:hypothetical protein
MHFTGFTKLSSGIVQSSIMLEDSDTFKAWIVFLASCESDGIARVSAVYISSICHFSLEKTLDIIKKLESPDPVSRSTNDEGRRIERINGGYRIINYLQYREYTYSDSPEAIKKRAQRDIGTKKGHVPNIGTKKGHVPDSLSSVLLSSTSSSLKSLEEESKKEESIIPEAAVLPKVEEEYLQVALTLKKNISETGTDMLFKEKALVDWANTFRLMVERDHRTVEQIRQKITAVFEDNFWKRNIRSADKLREQWNSGKLDGLNSSAGEATGQDNQVSDHVDDFVRVRAMGRFKEALKKYFPETWDNIVLPQETDYVWMSVEKIMKTKKARDGAFKIIMDLFRENGADNGTIFDNISDAK